MPIIEPPLSTLVPNAWMQDRRLSRRARGLLAELLSTHPDAAISLRSLADGGPEGLHAIRVAVNELEALGYLKRDTQEHDNTGRFSSARYALTEPSRA